MTVRNLLLCSYGIETVQFLQGFYEDLQGFHEDLQGFYESI